MDSASKAGSTTRWRVDRDGQMSGCVVLIGRQRGIVFEKAYGNRRVEPKWSR